MKLKDFLYIGIIVVLVIKILVTINPPPPALPSDNLKDSLKAYKVMNDSLERLLKKNELERDSLQNERQKIKVKYEIKYEKYRIKDSLANSLSVDSIQKFWTKRYDHN